MPSRAAAFKNTALLLAAVSAVVLAAACTDARRGTALAAAGGGEAAGGGGALGGGAAAGGGAAGGGALGGRAAGGRGPCGEAAGGFGGQGGHSEVHLLSALGEVSVYSGSGDRTLGHYVSARFEDHECAQRTITSLAFGVCAYVTEGFVVDPVNQSAGKLTITGGHFDYALSPTADSEYLDWSTGGPDLFGEGQTVTIAFSGDAVPAFEHTMMVPSGITIVAPSMQEWLAVDRSSGLVVTWQKLVAGRDVMVEVTADSDKTARVACAIDGAAGVVTVPAAALGMLALGNGKLKVSAALHETVHHGRWSVAFQLDANHLGDSTTIILQ